MNTETNGNGHLDEASADGLDVKAELDRLARTIAQQNARISDLENQINEIEAANDELHEQLDFIGDIKQRKTGKEEKVASIVQYAKNQYEKDTNRGAIKVKPSSITGIAGVSRRYAYDLIDSMAEEYPWAYDATNLREYGDMEKNGTERGVVIDFEGVHGEPVSVNKFTTPTREKGVS